MTLAERNKLYRIWKALNDVPGAHQGGSTKSVTVKGVADFAWDMVQIREKVSRAMVALYDGDPDITRAEREENFETPMRDAEAFIKRRQAECWR